MKPDIDEVIQDLIVPLAGALIFQLLSWSYMRSVRGGKPLTPVMKGMLFYGFFGALGMGYIFAAGSLLRSPPSGWYVLTFLWWAMLGWIAYWRHRKRTKMVVTQVEQRGIRWRLILEGFLFLALLVCLMGAAITLSVSLELHQSPLRGVFWLVGVFAAIILARRNRRVIVVTALRAFSALMLVGALTKLPSVAGFAVALIAGTALFVLSRFAFTESTVGTPLILKRLGKSPKL